PVIAQSTKKSPAPTGVVEGKVTVDGEAAVGIPVVLSLCPDDGSPIIRSPFKTASTDAAGQFRFEGIPAGRYCINGFAPALVPAESPIIQLKTFILEDAEPATNINLALIKGGVVTGRVIDADGQPVISEAVHADKIYPTGHNGATFSKTAAT